MRSTISYLVCFVLCTLFFAEFATVNLDSAEAGILSRGRSSRGIGVRTPRVRDRRVRSSTSAMRGTLPNLGSRGSSLDDIYSHLKRTEHEYLKRLARWEKTKQRVERRVQKRKRIVERQRFKESEKRRQAALKSLRKESSAKSKLEAFDPRSWFRKKIARVEEGGSLSLPKEKPQNTSVLQPEVSEPGTEQAASQKKKSIGFWGHIKRAIFGF